MANLKNIVKLPHREYAKFIKHIIPKPRNIETDYLKFKKRSHH